MERSEVANRLSEVLVSELGLEQSKIAEEAHFEEDLDVDSLGVWSSSWPSKTSSG